MIVVILVELVVAVLAGLSFIVCYAIWSDWHMTSMGRHIMAFVVVVTLEASSLLALGLGIRVPTWLFVFIFGLLDFVVVQRLILLLGAQRRLARDGTMTETASMRGAPMGQYAKAFVAGLVAGLTALLTALDSGGVSGQEWIAVAIATLSGLGLTALIPNQKPDPAQPFTRR